jgi:hypothetical protein
VDPPDGLGYDHSRDLINTPAFLAMLPDAGGRLRKPVGAGASTVESSPRGASAATR